jgi:hypothetical protein
MFAFPFLFLFLLLVLPVLVSPVVVPVDEAFAVLLPPLGVLELLRLQAPKEIARQTTTASRNTVSNFRIFHPPQPRMILYLVGIFSGSSQAFSD